MMQTGECLHGVGSFKQSLFPQAIAMAASFDTDLVYRIGRAIGTEARSIGIHACFSPVLDLAKDPRWGRAQGSVAASLTLSILLTFPRGLWRGFCPHVAYRRCLRKGAVKEWVMV